MQDARRYPAIGDYGLKNSGIARRILGLRLPEA